MPALSSKDTRKNPVRIAVVIPVFRQSALAWEAIHSTLDQGGETRFGVVVINDGCSFVSTQITTHAAAAHRGDVPVIALTQPNCGLSGARNLGVEAALRTWPDLEAIYFLDADNRLSPRSLTNMIEALDAHPDIDWFYPDIQMFGVKKLSTYEGRYSPELHIGQNYCEAGSLVRRRIFDAGVRYDEKMRDGFEDWEFWLSCIGAGFASALHLPAIQLRYRRRPESMLRDSERSEAQIRTYMKSKHPWLDRRERRADAEGNPEARFVVIGQSSGGYTNVASSTYTRIPLDQIERDFWQATAKAEAYAFPEFMVFASDAALKFLETRGLLPWCLWELQLRLRDANVASVALLPPSREEPYGIRLGEATSCQIGAVSMVRRSTFRDILRNGSHDWFNSIFTTASQVKHSVREIIHPEAAGVGGTHSVWMIRSAIDRFSKSPLNHPDLGAWAYTQSDLRTRNGRTSVFGPVQNIPTMSIARNGKWQVCFIVPFADFGGVERTVCQIARELTASGYEVHLVVLKGRPINLPPDMLAAFRSINWSPTDAVTDWSGGTYFGASMPTQFAPEQEAAMLALLADMDIVINAHGVGVHSMMGELRRLGAICIDYQHLVERTPRGQPVGHPFISLAYEHAYSAVMTCSQDLAVWLASHGVPREKLVAVPNGPGIPISTEDHQTALTRVQARAKRTEKAPLRVIFLGRLERQKGVDRLEELVARTAKFADIEWFGFGKSVVRDDTVSKKLAAIIKPPIYESAELKEALLTADVMVLPSRFEGLPLSIIDAMSLGVPVLATDVGAAREVIDDGVNGHVYAEESFVDLAEARLLELARNREELTRLSLSAIERAPSFSWKQRVIPLLKRLDQQLKTRSLPPLWPPRPQDHQHLD